ncbi:MAG: ABC transporter substrate-binding protein [Desulfovibrio sp.]|jgi:NitT/TauT family transport system substrate-binding protein|nr:ABC transporter substrate-binding protein [Desulfovibrio sp.]
MSDAIFRKLPSLPGTLLACALLACILAFSPGTGHGADAVKPTSIGMAYLENDIHHLALWVGMDRGIFGEEGIAPDIRGVFRAGPELMSGFASGELEAAYVGEAPSVIAAVRGTAKIKLLAQANTEGSAIVGVGDLASKKGKAPTIALPGRGGVQDVLLRKALPKLGLPPGGPEIVVIGPAEMQPALLTGQIDAFVAWEPYVAKAVGTGKARVIASSATIWPGHPCCALVVSERLVKEHPERVRALLRAHRRATSWIGAHKDEAAAIAVARTGMDLDTVKRAMDNVTYTAVPDMAGLKEYLAFLKGQGIIELADIDAFAGSFVLTGFWEGKAD